MQYITAEIINKVTIILIKIIDNYQVILLYLLYYLLLIIIYTVICVWIDATWGYTKRREQYEN